MVRTPCWPLARALSLPHDDPIDLARDSYARAAILCASSSLAAALARDTGDRRDSKASDRLRASTLRYLIRMTTRPTPFGLFAGCASIDVGARTSLRRAPSRDRIALRPDMEWLLQFVRKAEADPAILRSLRLFPHPTTVRRLDRLVAAGKSGRGATNAGDPSIRLTAAVADTLACAEGGLRWDTLVEAVCAKAPSRPADKVRELVGELISLGFLHSELRPPLAGSRAPVDHVFDRLSAIAPASPHTLELAEVMAKLAHASQADRAALPAAIRQALEAFGAGDLTTRRPPLQADLAIGLSGTIGENVVEEAARAASLLIRLSTQPRGLVTTTAYRKAFIGRYGPDRYVPLLELVDPLLGLGPIDGFDGRAAQGDHAWLGPRNALLLDLATGALRDGSPVIQLDRDMLDALSHPQQETCELPASLDLAVLVAASNSAAIDRGDFKLIVGPNVGAWAAGKNFGRFAGLEDASGLTTKLQAVARAEAALHGSHIRWVETSYYPTEPRLANVMIRPAVRDAEITMGTAPGDDGHEPIALADLIVGVEDERFVVRSRTTGQVYRFVAGHMLNDRTAPPPVQFLLRAANDGVAALTGFNWGTAEGFPVLPRVECGRIILRLAEWRLRRTAADTDDAAVRKWCTDWKVPRRVLLARGDNRLALDLASAAQFAELMTEFRGLPAGGTLILQEMLPSFDDAWLEGEQEGRWYSELIVPLLRADTATVPAQAPPPPAALFDRRERLSMPGSEWLFAKLYGAKIHQDHVIANLSGLTSGCVATGLVSHWFFLRYADPEPHIRLRLRVRTDGAAAAFEAVNRWAKDHLDRAALSGVEFAPYDREIERYGGIDGLSVCEHIFFADSAFAIDAVKGLSSRQWQSAESRLAVTALTIDRLLADFGWDSDQRRQWYAQHRSANGIAIGRAYRANKRTLGDAVGFNPAWQGAGGAGEALTIALTARSQRIVPQVDRLRTLAEHGRLHRTLDQLALSLAHLAVNRLGTAEHEALLYGLLERTLVSLAAQNFRI